RMTASDLTLVGTSHHHAPVEVRERVALDGDAAAALAAELAAEGYEAVCLSTCNRTELYLVGVGAEPRADRALADLPGGEMGRVLYRLHNEAAGLHAFRLAAGLDPMGAGEGGIPGQVGAAFRVRRTRAGLWR